MELPALQVLVDWRRQGFNRLAVGGFDASTTTDWSVSAGINAAGTSLTPSFAAAFVGNLGLRIVCSGANSSGAHATLSGNFVAGRTYRLRFIAKRGAGSTFLAKATLGSLGTGADRTTVTFTLTANYSQDAFVTVDWTPSSTRSDVQVAIMANAAAALTIDVDQVEVYEAINDITDDLMSDRGATGLVWGMGANFDGSAESPGPATLTALNVEGKYDKRNAAGPLFGMLKPKRRIQIRALYVPVGYANGDPGVMYGCFAGVIRNIVPKPGTNLAEILCQDMLWLLKKTPYSASGADNLSYTLVRDLALAEAGVSSAQTSYPSGGPERQTFYSFTPKRPVLDYLADLNQANGSIHFIQPDADLDVLFRYTVRDRRDVIDGTPSGIAEEFDNSDHDQLMWVRNFDDSDENIQNIKRVRPHPIAQRGVFDMYWRTSLQSVPFTVPAGESSDGFFVDFSKEVPVYKPASGDNDAVGEYTFPLGRGFYMSGTAVRVNGSFTLVTASRSIDVVYHPKAVYFEITAIGSPFTVTSLEVWGTRAVEDEERAGFRQIMNDASIAEHGKARGSDIDNPYIPDGKRAKALAKYWTDRYADARARFDLDVKNRFPSQLVRQIGERVNVTDISDELALNGVPAVIRSLETRVSKAGKLWETTFKCEEIPDTTPAYFTLGTSVLGGTDVLA